MISFSKHVSHLVFLLGQAPQFFITSLCAVFLLEKGASWASGQSVELMLHYSVIGSSALSLHFSPPFTSNLTLGRGAWLPLEYHHIHFTLSAPWLCEDVMPTGQVYPDIIWKEDTKTACVSRRSPEQVDLMELARQPTPWVSWFLTFLFSQNSPGSFRSPQLGLLERIQALRKVWAWILVLSLTSVMALGMPCNPC